MSKAVKYAQNGAVIFGITNALLNALNQLEEKKGNLNLKFDWSRLLQAGGKGALVGGVGGAVIGGIIDWENSREEPLNTNAIMNRIITDLKLSSEDPVYQTLSAKAAVIVKLIQSRFKSQLGGKLIKIGSTEENTALQEDFDIDITIPFKPNSFASTSIMFEELFSFLESEYDDKDLVKIRKQKKSIGILYQIGDYDCKIDLVPYKQSKTQDKTIGYLFVNNNSLFREDSYTKTDISALKSINLTPTQQKLVVAFKGWKRKLDLPLSSHLLKLLIVEAYKKQPNPIPRAFTGKVLMVARYIEDNIEERRVVSLENTNNVLTQMPYSEKRQIRTACRRLREDYDYQPNSMLEYFEPTTSLI